MSKTVSALIPNTLHSELCERCNKVGCSINVFIQGSLELVINDYTDFDFGGEEESEPPKSPEIKVIDIE